MYIEIEFPSECITLDEKREHLHIIYEWGVENLDDQEAWRHFDGMKNVIRANTLKIEYHIEHESDAMAIKLAWS